MSLKHTVIVLFALMCITTITLASIFVKTDANIILAGLGAVGAVSAYAFNIVHKAITATGNGKV